MSLTAELTPYDAEEIARQQEERARQQEAARARRKARQQERLRVHHEKLEEPSRVPLHVDSLDSLSASAERLGYKKVELSGSRVRLERARGEMIELRRRGHKTEAVSAKGIKAVQEVVRQHTVDRAVEHCARRGLEVRVRKLANGEVQIEGVEKTPSASGQQAMLEVDVHSDGRLAVDVKCVSGPACGQIVSELALAVGAVTEKARHKSEYFQQLNQQKQKLRI